MEVARGSIEKLIEAASWDLQPGSIPIEEKQIVADTTTEELWIDEGGGSKKQTNNLFHKKGQESYRKKTVQQ